MTTNPKTNRQTTGNVGMYYACYQLSRLGLNVMPTSRNAKGADIIAYTPDQTRFLSFQVKAQTKLSNISLRQSLDDIDCDWWIVVTDVYSDPITFVLTKDEIKQSARLYKGNYWAQGKQLDNTITRNGWNRILCPPNPNNTELSDQTFTQLDKIKRWARNPDQINHQLIRAFLELEKVGHVTKEAFKKRCESKYHVKNFASNFSSMLTDRGGSNGKVFREDGINVWMWPQVRTEVDRYFK